MSVIKIVGPDLESMSKLVAKTCFLSGFSVQSFCLPSGAYIKFDKKPIISRQEEFSDMLLVMASADLKDSLKHVKEKSIIILNAKERPKLPEIKKRRLHLYVLDANELALNTLRKPVPNMPMLGALTKSYEKITLRAAKQAAGESKESHLAIDEGFKNVK